MEITTALLLVISVLLVFIIYQGLFFTRQVNKLVDKVMSRDYVTYVQAEGLKKEPKVEHRVKIEPEEVPEDLGVLNGL